MQSAADLLEGTVGCDVELESVAGAGEVAARVGARGRGSRALEVVGRGTVEGVKSGAKGAGDWAGRARLEMVGERAAKSLGATVGAGQRKERARLVVRLEVCECAFPWTGVGAADVESKDDVVHCPTGDERLRCARGAIHGTC